MGVEIERRFLVVGDEWRGDDPGTRMCQGYLSVVPERTVRVRLAGDRATMTIKGRSEGARRLEFENPLPVSDAEEILQTLCLRPLIDKTRYRVPFGGWVWEIDVFHGENAGLVLAEVELPDENADVTLPSWVGEEITADHRYSNAGLVQRPWSRW